MGMWLKWLKVIVVVGTLLLHILFEATPAVAGGARALVEVFRTVPRLGRILKIPSGAASITTRLRLSNDLLIYDAVTRASTSKSEKLNALIEHYLYPYMPRSDSPLRPHILSPQLQKTFGEWAQADRDIRRPNRQAYVDKIDTMEETVLHIDGILRGQATANDRWYQEGNDFISRLGLTVPDFSRPFPVLIQEGWSAENWNRSVFAALEAEKKRERARERLSDAALIEGLISDQDHAWVRPPVETLRRHLKGLQLTDRQLAMMRLFSQGMTKKAIAQQLGLSRPTVHGEFNRVFERARHCRLFEC